MHTSLGIEAAPLNGRLDRKRRRRRRIQAQQPGCCRHDGRQGGLGVCGPRRRGPVVLVPRRVLRSRWRDRHVIVADGPS